MSESPDLRQNGLSINQMRAFKIGARARKFVLEGCLIEGYDYIYGCIQEAESSDEALHALLKVELEKFERRIASMDDETDL